MKDENEYQTVLQEFFTHYDIPGSLVFLLFLLLLQPASCLFCPSARWHSDIRLNLEFNGILFTGAHFRAITDSPGSSIRGWLFV